MIVEAGVRAELLLNRLDGYALLGDADESDNGEDEEALDITEGDGEEVPELVDSQAHEIALEAPEDEGEDISAPITEPVLSNPDVNSADYLASGLIFTEDRLLDEDKNGVMMAWETNIMKRTADILTPCEGLRVLNIGHGMGIIDEFFRSKLPSSHHIVEAHPAVLQRMKEDGMYRRPGVTVHEGRWQDVLPKLVEQNVLFDAIYFDTFAEDYKALKEFFGEYVIGLLDPAGGENGEGGRFGFFNGLGADRQVCYDVYTKVVEMDLFDAGFDTEWEDIQIPNAQDPGQWEGVRRRYWVLDNYRLPTCRFLT
ncbi:Arginine N-methyltransferase 2 [Cryomyces antarcticus]|uniref:Protein arginine N-methyltransferase 2 n=1 Tax=Cryomyces antarcticus TaxID=329879 RepID=A0ABR0LPS1_9PEZI|nr:Arginine N-methyltransferase 2 [Cryomyces antarcticus]